MSQYEKCHACVWKSPGRGSSNTGTPSSSGRESCRCSSQHSKRPSIQQGNPSTVDELAGTIRRQFLSFKSQVLNDARFRRNARLSKLCLTIRDPVGSTTRKQYVQVRMQFFSMPTYPAWRIRQKTTQEMRRTPPTTAAYDEWKRGFALLPRSAYCQPRSGAYCAYRRPVRVSLRTYNPTYLLPITLPTYTIHISRFTQGN
jgi:hypothetical protein